MKVLVTGHQGFIGSYLIPEYPGAEGLDIRSGNDILECHLPDADVVIHLAAQPGVIASVEDPYTNARTNILGTIRLAQRYKDARFIFASSGGTIQDTIESPYGLSKKTCEEYIKLICNDYVILRFPNVYGKGSRSVVDKFLAESKLTIYGDGAQTRTYGHVSDIVKAIKQSVNWPSGTYKLGSHQNYSVGRIAEATGKPIRYEPSRKGELARSSLPNKTYKDSWHPTIELMEYIQDVINNNP